MNLDKWYGNYVFFKAVKNYFFILFSATMALYSFGNGFSKGLKEQNTKNQHESVSKR
jgi:hypothetical protein